MPAALIITNAEDVPVELREMALNYFQDVIGEFEQQIKGSQESGTVDGKLDAGVLATEAMCLLIGFMHLARLDCMRREKNPHVRTVLTTWSRSIKPRSVQTSQASR